MSAPVVDPVDPIRLDDGAAMRVRVVTSHVVRAQHGRPRVTFRGGENARTSFASAFVAFALSLAALGALASLARVGGDV